MPTPIQPGHTINRLGAKNRPLFKCYIDTSTQTLVHRWTKLTKSLGDTTDRMAAFCFTNGFSPKSTPPLNEKKK